MSGIVVSDGNPKFYGFGYLMCDHDDCTERLRRHHIHFGDHTISVGPGGIHAADLDEAIEVLTRRMQRGVMAIPDEVDR